jgi:hypothetical protein
MLKQTARLLGETGFLFFVAFMAMPSFVHGVFTTAEEQRACQVVHHVEKHCLLSEIISNLIGNSFFENVSPPRD